MNTKLAVIGVLLVVAIGIWAGEPPRNEQDSALQQILSMMGFEKGEIEYLMSLPRQLQITDSMTVRDGSYLILEDRELRRGYVVTMRSGRVVSVEEAFDIRKKGRK